MALTLQQSSHEAASKIYSPICSDKNEIRLLELKAGAKGSPIECQLHVFCLDSTPRIYFEALSYVWGSEMASEPILLQGIPYPVTANLHVVLEQFRTPYKGTCLWVDALCVNQTDLLERGEQVKLMHRIYSEAFDTLVWLGPEEEESYLAFQLIELFCYIYEDCRKEYRRTGNFDTTRWGIRSSWRIERHMRALTKLLERPWFYRVWIIQEVAMSRNIAICCGDQMTTWTKLAELSYFVNRFGAEFGGDRIWNGVTRIGAIDSTWCAQRTKLVDQQLDMLVLLALHRESRATDPRDKCIALIGLTKGRFQQQSSDVYLQSVRSVYCNVMAQVMEDASELPLSFLAYTGHPASNKDLPSWVPDWSYHEFAGPRFPRWHIQRTGISVESLMPFDILPDFDLTQTIAYVLSDDKNELFASAIIIDRISGYTGTPRGDSIGYNTKERPDGLDRKSLAPTNLSWIYSTCEAVEDVLWRTLVFDRDDNGCPVDPERWKWMFYQLFGKVAIHKDRVKDAGHKSELHSIEVIFSQLLELYDTFPLKDNTTIGDVVRDQYLRKPMKKMEPLSFEEVVEFRNALINATVGRRLAMSSQGYLGLVPAYAEKDDFIIILLGCPVPVIMRKHDDWYEFVGTCYIHGIMEGEIVSKIDKGECQPVMLEIR